MLPERVRAPEERGLAPGREGRASDSLRGMKIYTRTGDGGTTALFGGERVAKSSARIRAIGSVDEANAHLGTARVAWRDGGADDDGALDAQLHDLQNALFDVGADLATPEEVAARAHLHPIDAADVARLERAIDRFDADVAALQHFILPGGHAAAAHLHVARTVLRRAERETVALGQEVAVHPHVAAFLNRASDLAFVLARWVNARMDLPEAPWAADGRDREDAPAEAAETD